MRVELHPTGTSTTIYPLVTFDNQSGGWKEVYLTALIDQSVNGDSFDLYSFDLVVGGVVAGEDLGRAQVIRLLSALDTEGFEEEFGRFLHVGEDALDWWIERSWEMVRAAEREE